MAKIKERNGRKVLVLAWTGEKYKEQEAILSQYPRSGDVTALIMEALKMRLSPALSVHTPTSISEPSYRGRLTADVKENLKRFAL
jgi:hypothetical protein